MAPQAYSKPQRYPLNIPLTLLIYLLPVKSRRNCSTVYGWFPGQLKVMEHGEVILCAGPSPVPLFLANPKPTYSHPWGLGSGLGLGLGLPTPIPGEA